MEARHHLLAAAELSTLRDLEILARTTVEGLRQGLHRSPFHGYSAEFSQYRHYRPGDDLKHVDWKAFGRTDRLFTRQFRETTNLAALLVADISRSMDFPPAVAEAPLTATKHGLAQAVAAALAMLIIDQGDTAGLLALGAETTYLPPRSGRHHLHQLLAAIARLRPEGSVPPSAALARAAVLLRRKGLVIVLTDFYEEDETLAELRRVARMGHDVVVVHVLAREELALPGRGAAELVDLESGSRVTLDIEAVRPGYRESVAAFLRRVEAGVAAEGIGYLQVTTGEPLEHALRRYLVRRRQGA